MTNVMTREEFQEIVNEVSGRTLVSGYGKKAKYTDCAELSIEWSTGRLTGGSCWGTGDDTYYHESGDPEPEFEELDDILLRVAPTLGFLHYKKLLQKAELTDRRENDYYGNHSDYARKTIKVDDIWDFLIEYKLITKG